MSKLTSPMGRKWIPWLLSVLVVSVGLNIVAGVRVWNYMREEAAAQVAEEHQTALEMADLGQKQAQKVARALVEGKGKPGCDTSTLPDGFVKLNPDGTKTILHN